VRQTNELDRVKTRIKALAEKTVSNGCTEAEAMAAAEMVGRLLDRYALSMDEIEVREQRCVEVEVRIGGQRRRPVDCCVTGIARFCDCKVWFTRDEVGVSYVFFGFEADTALAAYLLEVINRAIRTELAIFRTRCQRLKGTALRRASISFQRGMATRVAERLNAVHQARDVGMATQRSTGTALMLLKHQVVEEAFQETGIRLVSGGGLGRRRVDVAFRHGVEAGNRVNLDRPVSGTDRSLLA
jgi:hypothetical protein